MCDFTGVVDLTGRSVFPNVCRARLRLVPPVGLSDWQNIISCCELKRSLVTKLCMQVPASANLLSHTDLIETWKVEDLFFGVNVAF
jgi:hypothetical protein